MKKENNLYNYIIPKAGNEETSYFLTKGRITAKAFFLRLLLCSGVFALFYSIAVYYGEQYGAAYSLGEKDAAEQLIEKLAISNFFAFSFVLPLIALFILIQGAKRMHDVNKSSWFFFLPLYNFYWAFKKGTIGANDYGIDPRPITQVTYFDELEKEPTQIEQPIQIEETKTIQTEGNKFTTRKSFSAFNEVSSSLYLGEKITQKKLHAFGSRFNADFISKCVFFVYYDRTIFGKGDEGFAVLKYANKHWYLLCSDGSSSVGFTIGLHDGSTNPQIYEVEALGSKLNLSVVLHTVKDKRMRKQTEIQSFDFYNEKVAAALCKFLLSFPDVKKRYYLIQ